MVAARHQASPLARIVRDGLVALNSKRVKLFFAPSLPLPLYALNGNGDGSAPVSVLHSPQNKMQGTGYEYRTWQR